MLLIGHEESTSCSGRRKPSAANHQWRPGQP